MHYSLAPAQGQTHARLIETLAACVAEIEGLPDLVRRCGALRDGRSCC
jgi:hypothetical protein